MVVCVFESRKKLKCFSSLGINRMERQLAKFHGSEKSMILSHLERQGQGLSTRAAGGLPKRAGEEARTQDGSKGRFCTPKSFASCLGA